MKNKFRILISLLFFFFTTHSYSNTINKINFIGLNNTSAESLLVLIPFKAGQEYTRIKTTWYNSSDKPMSDPFTMG